MRRLQGWGLRGSKGGTLGVCGGVVGRLGGLDSGEWVFGSGEKVGEGVGLSCIGVIDDACDVGRYTWRNEESGGIARCVLRGKRLG